MPVSKTHSWMVNRRTKGIGRSKAELQSHIGFNIWLTIEWTEFPKSLKPKARRACAARVGIFRRRRDRE
jgi:hypothetical protein